MASVQRVQSNDSVPASEFLLSQQRVLKEKQTDSLIAQLEALNATELIDAVKSEVGSGQHLSHFPERKQFWESCARDNVLDKFVAALRLEYASLLRECLKAREKYANIQVKWMEFLRLLLHECSRLECPVVQLWEKMIQMSGESTGSQNIIAACIEQSVFMYC